MSLPATTPPPAPPAATPAPAPPDLPPLPEGYRIVRQIPSVADYLRLRVSAGLSPRSAEAASAGLPNSFAAVIAEFDGQAVAMARAVGDCGLFVQIVDVAVDPAHQGRGLGGQLMAALIDEVRRKLPAEAYLSLIADGQANRLYARFGFQPTAPQSIGMALWIQGQPAQG